MIDETQDSQTPDTQTEDAPAPPPADALADAQMQIADLQDRLLRQVAETENMRRRLEREKQDAGTYAITSFAREMLGVADNLRRALSSAPETADPAAPANPVLIGVEMTEKELQNNFAKAGIVRIEAVGEKLDPNRHQAMVEVPTAEAAPGTIIQVLQDGYMIKDRLLRPAMVIVAKAADTPPASPTPGGNLDTSA